MKKHGFKFRYNEYEKPSSKSYLAPNIKEVEIIKYEISTEDGKTVFKIFTKKGEELSEIALEQLTLHFMNLYNINSYSDIIIQKLDVFEEKN